MRSEIPQVIWHTCRFVIFRWKLWWAEKNYGRIAIKLSSADDRVQLRRSRYEDGSRPTKSGHAERRRWFREKLKDTFIMHTSWKSLECYYHRDDLSFQMTTLRLDARHRATNTGKNTSWNWRPDGARGAFSRFTWTWRMFANDRSRTLAETDSLF